VLGYATIGFTRDYGISIGSVFSAFLMLMVGFAMGIFVITLINTVGGIIIIGIFFYLTYFMSLYAYY
jgi:hypothetical protein